MSDLIVLISLIWGAGMTGLVLYYRERANERTIMGIALLATIKSIAEGKAYATVDSEGNIKITEAQNGL